MRLRRLRTWSGHLMANDLSEDDLKKEGTDDGSPGSKRRLASGVGLYWKTLKMRSGWFKPEFRID